MMAQGTNSCRFFTIRLSSDKFVQSSTMLTAIHPNVNMREIRLMLFTTIHFYKGNFQIQMFNAYEPLVPSKKILFLFSEYKHLQCGNDPCSYSESLMVVQQHLSVLYAPTVIACRAIDVIFRFCHYFLFDRIMGRSCKYIHPVNHCWSDEVEKFCETYFCHSLFCYALQMLIFDAIGLQIRPSGCSFLFV